MYAIFVSYTGASGTISVAVSYSSNFSEDLHSCRALIDYDNVWFFRNLPILIAACCFLLNCTLRMKTIGSSVTFVNYLPDYRVS